MTRLLNFVRRPGDSTPMYIGPEEIVREAERLGRVSCERDYTDTVYNASIKFKNRNGSTISAAGVDQEFFTALAKAVQEAERLK